MRRAYGVLRQGVASAKVSWGGPGARCVGCAGRPSRKARWIVSRGIERPFRRRVSLFNAQGCVYVSEVITAISRRRDITGSSESQRERSVGACHSAPAFSVEPCSPKQSPPAAWPRGLGVWPAARQHKEPSVMADDSNPTPAPSSTPSVTGTEQTPEQVRAAALAETARIDAIRATRSARLLGLGRVSVRASSA